MPLAPGARQGAVRRRPGCAGLPLPPSGFAAVRGAVRNLKRAGQGPSPGPHGPGERTCRTTRNWTCSEENVSAEAIPTQGSRQP